MKNMIIIILTYISIELKFDCRIKLIDTDGIAKRPPEL